RLVVYNNAITYVTRSICTNNIEGFVPFGAVTHAYALIRGNDFTDYAGPIHFYCFIGNKRDKGAGSTQFMRLVSKTNTSTLLPQIPICAFNRIYWLTTNGGNFTALYTTESAPPAGFVGAAVVQNLLEQCNASGSPIIAVGADGSIWDCDNVIVWHNDSFGQRNNSAYNDEGSTDPTRDDWSEVNNLFDNLNRKTETFINSPFSSLTRSGTTATATMTVHNLTTGDIITVVNVTPSEYNGVFEVTVLSASQFTYEMLSDPGAS